jgi:hypothetical protein
MFIYVVENEITDLKEKLEHQIYEGCSESIETFCSFILIDVFG